jgi:beta-lactam-binding protein with PASTA domain
MASTGSKGELTPQEHREAKKRSGSTATLVGIFAVVIFVVALLAIFVFPTVGEWMSSPDEQITIPEFVGRRYDDIRFNSEYFQLYLFDTTFEPNNDVAEGVVIAQDPAANRTRAHPLTGERITVRLIVSSGDEPPIEMPDLVGLHYVEARNQLLNLQLELIIDLEPVQSDQSRGIVVETLPRFRDTLSRGNQVVIRYSAGPEDVTVVIPDMVGQTEAAVVAAFAELGLVPNITRFEDASPEGTVTFIGHHGQTVPAGTSVAVHVSSGPAATPEPIPTPPPEEPTPTPPPEPTPTPTSPAPPPPTEPTPTPGPGTDPNDEPEG